MMGNHHLVAAYAVTNQSRDVLYLRFLVIAVYQMPAAVLAMPTLTTFGPITPLIEF